MPRVAYYRIKIMSKINFIKQYAVLSKINFLNNSNIYAVFTSCKKKKSVHNIGNKFAATIMMTNTLIPYKAELLYFYLPGKKVSNNLKYGKLSTPISSPKAELWQHKEQTVAAMC